MPLRPRTILPIPEETARTAGAAFPKGNLHLQIRDEIGVLFHDEDFADLLTHPMIWTLILEKSGNCSGRAAKFT